jgi:hypothetical protein
MEMNVSDSDNGSSFPSLEVSTCSGADDLQLNWYLNFAWWLEGFLQLVTGKGKKFRILKLIFVTRGIFNPTPGKKSASLRCLYKYLPEKISVKTIIFRKQYFLCFCCLNEILSKISKSKKSLSNMEPSEFS